MNIILPTKSFGCFKVALSLLLLSSFVIYPTSSFIILVMLAVGKAHSFGAWFSMWRAGKLNMFYGTSVLLIGFTVSWWGIVIATPQKLALATYILFAFHFFYGEFDLLLEKRSINNILSIISPGALLYLYLFSKTYLVSVNWGYYLVILLVFFSISIYFLRELNWFFINSQILALYIIFSVYLAIDPYTVLGTFLMLHYLFWFILPVYKLNLTKKNEVGGFVIILLFLSFSSIVTSTLFLHIFDIPYSTELELNAFKAFLVGTIIHILSTPPFGFLIGLKKIQIPRDV